VTRPLNAVGRGFPVPWRRGSRVWLFCGAISCLLATLALTVVCIAAAKSSAAMQREQKADLPEGFAIDLKASEADVLKAVDLVA